MMQKQRFGSTVAFAMVVIAMVGAGDNVAGQAQKIRKVAGCDYVPQEFHRCALEKARTFSPPRTPDGKPDLQGLWETPGGAYNFEGPAPGSEGAPNRSFIIDPPDGKVPYLPWALGHREKNVAQYLDPYTVCLPAAPPRQLAL